MALVKKAKAERANGEVKKKKTLKKKEPKATEPRTDKPEDAEEDIEVGIAVPKAKKAKVAKTVEIEIPTDVEEEVGVSAKCDAKTGAKLCKDIKGLSKPTMAALAERGITSLFEVQHKAFSPALKGTDTVGRAKTGCGKTLAFCLPVVERIVADGLSSGKAGRKPLMLALAPTRELAKQIHTELISIAKVHNLEAACLYGGAPFGPQCEELRWGLDAVVATPGRLLDHIRRETIKLDSVQFVVLDEADEMLSMGFQDDVEEILAATPKGSQKLLFSATMPKWVQNLIAKHLQPNHVVIDVVGEGADNHTNANITHECISCAPFERGETLADLCKVHAGAFGKTLVFTDTKKECDELAQNAKLIAMGAGVLHGDIPQKSREVTMENFRSGKIKLLIATDVAARGLDVPNVDLVVMTHPPQDLDTYVHRSGRTARGGRTGTCITFYSMREEYMLRLLRNKKGIPIKRRGPPQPCEIVRQAARDAVRQVDTIHQDNVDAFTKVAQELIDERESAVFLLAASLAAMTGYTERIKFRSLLTSFEGSQAMLLESDRGIEATSKAWYLIRNTLSEEIHSKFKAMSLIKGGKAVIFDCPSEHVHHVLSAECWKGIKFSLATELPELEGRPGQSAADDEWEHKESQKRRWEKIQSWKSGKADEKAFSKANLEDRKGKGKSKGDNGKGFGKGKSSEGGRGKGKGKSGGRGFA